MSQCEIHQEKLVSFCVADECLKAVCGTCVEEEHEAHRRVDITEKVKDLQHLKDIRKKLVMERTELKRLEKENEQTKDQVLGVKNSMEIMARRFGKLKEKVTAEADSEVRELDEVQNGITKFLDLGDELRRKLCRLPHSTLAENLDAFSDALKKSVAFLGTSARVKRSTPTCKVLHVQSHTKSMELIISNLKWAWLEVDFPHIQTQHAGKPTKRRKATRNNSKKFKPGKVMSSGARRKSLYHHDCATHAPRPSADNTPFNQTTLHKKTRPQAAGERGEPSRGHPKATPSSTLSPPLQHDAAHPQEGRVATDPPPPVLSRDAGEPERLPRIEPPAEVSLC